MEFQEAYRVHEYDKCTDFYVKRKILIMIKNLYEDLMFAEEVVQICGHHEWFVRCNYLMETWEFSFEV